MNLPPMIEESIAEKVASGRFESADAVLARAFELLEASEREISRIRAKNLHAIEQLDRGEGIPAEEAFEEIFRQNRERPG